MRDEIVESIIRDRDWWREKAEELANALNEVLESRDESRSPVVMEQVTAHMRAWLDRTSFVKKGSPTYIRLVILADEIDQLAEDEVAYAITQTRNDYEDWLDPHEAEHQRQEYYDQGWSDAVEEFRQEKSFRDGRDL